jgi:mono/diheme cytochrome c family protein
MKPVSTAFRVPVLATLLLSAGAGNAQGLEEMTGAQLYQRFCSACHGAGGHGDGPVAGSFRTLIPDLTRISQRSGGRFPGDRILAIVDGRADIAAHGSRAMPVWGYGFAAVLDEAGGNPAASQVLVNRLVEYLASIQQ